MSDSRDEYEHDLPVNSQPQAAIEPPYVDEKKARMLNVLKANGFEMKNEIASGVTGTVAIFKYTGRDPEISQLLTNGTLLIKLPATSLKQEDIDSLPEKERKVVLAKMDHAIQTYANEWNNITVLNSIKSQSTVKQHNLPSVLAFEIEGIKIIANRCINYNDKPKNAGQYMREAGQTHKQWSASHSASEISLQGHAMGELFREKVDNIVSSSYESLYHLHQLDFLHRDFSGRNVALENQAEKSVTIDFGASVPCAENGNALYNMDFPLIPNFIYNQDALQGIYDRKQAAKTTDDNAPPDSADDKEVEVKADSDDENSYPPADNYEEEENAYPPADDYEEENTEENQNTLVREDKHFSISTDLFSHRVFIIESLAEFCSVKNIKEDIHKPGLDLGMDRKLRDVDDNTRLSNSVKNLENIANDLIKANDIRGKVAMDTIDKYRNYLTSMPKKGLERNATMIEDKKLFSRCALIDTASIMARLGGVKGMTASHEAAIESHIKRENSAITSSSTLFQKIEKKSSNNMEGANKENEPTTPKPK